MATTLKVSLDTSTDPWSLSVDQKDKANHVPRGSLSQIITWQLTGNAINGSFVALTEKEPGFEWTGNPPTSGIFSGAAIGKDGNLTINDLNDAARTVGEWFYILRVNVGGTIYSTITTLLHGTTKNPSIKNN